MADYPAVRVPVTMAPAMSDSAPAQRIYGTASDPSTAVGADYVNKVWDTVAGSWVRWRTSTIDLTGASYPGPGTWGVHTSDFRIETIEYDRT